VPKRDDFIKHKNQLKGMLANTLFIKGIRVFRDLTILSNEQHIRNHFDKSLIQEL
jgi:hypothetical protein